MDARVRMALLALFVCGATGTAVELLLLEHTEELVQWVPLAAIATSLALLATHGLARHRVTVRAFQGVMMLFLAAGAAGVVLHYRGNLEFARERDPEIAGGDLFRRVIKGATPVLAPGTMALLGSIGLLYAYRHPALGHPRRPASTEE
jgi:hypothetical protein